QFSHTTILSKQASTAVLYEFLCMAELGCKNVEFAQICLLNTLQMRYNKYRILPKRGGNAVKKILFVASEAVPFIKTGGLADVVGSLPKYFDKEQYDIRVMIPKY